MPLERGWPILLFELLLGVSSFFPVLRPRAEFPAFCLRHLALVMLHLLAALLVLGGEFLREVAVPASEVAVEFVETARERLERLVGPKVPLADHAAVV